jgi:hypothetical protein
LLEVEEGVYGGEEGTVEPSSTLRDELRNGVWDMLAYVEEAWERLTYQVHLSLPWLP